MDRGCGKKNGLALKYHGGQQGRLISPASSERVGVVLGLGLMAIPLNYCHHSVLVSCSNLLKTRSGHLI